MEMFEGLLLLLLGAVGLSALSRRLGLPYPSLLALAGVGLALVPWGPKIVLDPKLALALFVAPVLLDAAYDSSPRDLKRNWLPVGSLVLVAVGLTTAAVAWAAKTMVPQMPWAAAIALGAIVAPPDAAAATAVLRQVGLPYRLKVILEGESLLNDASALLIYRLAVTATAAGGSLSPLAIAPVFLLSIVGSVVFALVASRVIGAFMGRVQDAPSSIILQFVTTFGVWIAAERLGLSPILTVFVYAVAVARRSPARTGARLRVPSYAVWETAVLVLNALAFVLVGLQLRPILAGLPARELRHDLLVAGVVLAVVVGVRAAWILVFNGAVRVRNRVAGPEARSTLRPTWRGGVAVAWAGMRGIVTLAAALALPQGFPQRDLILLTAFAVVLGTLTIQGLTLRPLLKALDLKADDTVEREVRDARVELSRVALEALEGDDSFPAKTLRKELQAERETAENAEAGDGRAQLPVQDLRRRTLDRRRTRLFELRGDGTISDDAFHRLEEELDYADLATPEQAGG